MSFDRRLHPRTPLIALVLAFAVNCGGDGPSGLGEPSLPMTVGVTTGTLLRPDPSLLRPDSSR